MEGLELSYFDYLRLGIELDGIIVRLGTRALFVWLKSHG
jgi:hypothetical protein